MRLPRQALRWLAQGAILVGGATLAVRAGLPAPATSPDQLRPEEDSGDSGRGRHATPPSAGAQRAGHETGDMDAALMARLLVALAAGLVVMVGGIFGFRALVSGLHQRAQPPLTAEQTAPTTPPAPHLQADPTGDLVALQQRDDARLNGYGWIDQTHTRARIPIERAMALTVGRPLDPAP